MNKRIIKTIKRAELDEEQRKVDIENRRIERLPYWMSPLADYLPEDDQGWDECEED